MTVFQLDQCCNYPELAANCNHAGICTIHVCPHRFHGKSIDDDEMLSFAIQRNASLLTIDHTIIEDSDGPIPIPNRGIIIIQKKRRFPTITFSIPL
jgi:hypothetical protein